jgi:PRC-barrel domain
MTYAHDPLEAHPDFALRGRTVVDTRHAEVGTITDVIFDDISSSPNWAIVKTGAWRGEHYMPLSDTYVADDGRLVAPFDRASVKRAPKARRDHVVTPEVARDLRDYYGRAA